MISHEKIWICYFLSASFENKQNFSKKCNFSPLGESNAFTFNPFGPKILWKIDVNKKTKSRILNDHISKTRTNSESKLKFSESSFNLLQNSVYFCSLYPRGYTAGGSTLYNPHCCCQRFAGLKGKGLMMSQKKNWTCSLLSISFTNEQKLLINCNFSLLGKINVFTYPIKPWNTLKNCHLKKKQLP